MFVYEKKLQYPINIKNTNPKLAALIISQYGGPYCHKLQRSHLWKTRDGSLLRNLYRQQDILLQYYLLFFNHLRVFP